MSIRVQIGVLCLLLGVSASRVPADDAAGQVKAVFVYNFIQFVRWPHRGDDDDFHIGVLGDSPIVKPLSAIAKIKKVGKHSIAIKQFGAGEGLEACKILIVPEGKANQSSGMRDSLEAMNVLVVGDGLTFDGEERPAINFVVVGWQAQVRREPVCVEKIGTFCQRSSAPAGNAC